MRAFVFWPLVALAVAAALPPFFTRGACTQEFDAAGALLEQARPQLLSLTAAQRFLVAHGLGYRLVSAERCESAPLREVESCPGGPLLLGVVPVKNLICRYYRDNNVRFQLSFNNHEQLVRIQMDMDPYRRLRIPFYGEVELSK
jgi:hypothetical protein